MLAFAAALALTTSASAVTTLTIGELELQGGTSAAVPVEYQSDVSVAAVQMDVLFDPAAYSAATATAGTQAESFRVDSRLVEAGRLRVVVGAPNNAPLGNGTVFRVPLTAVDQFASFFPVVLTDFALATADGAAVAGKIAPRVRLINLTDNARINGSGGVQLAVEAGATDGSVARVDYFVGDLKIGSSAAAPFGITWTPPGSGPFVIRAIAFDSNELQTASRGIPIVVTNVGTTALKGLYAGLVKAEPFAFSTTGFLQFATTADGGFTAKLTLGGETFSKQGRFAGDGAATVKFKRDNGRTSLVLTLQQYATRLIDQIAGQLTDGTVANGTVTGATFTAEVLADRSLWKKRTNEPAERGTYTIVFPSATDAAADNAPLGDGIGVVKVSRAGAITAALTLADGTKVTQGTFLSKDKRWPLFASLYKKGKGVLAGEVVFADEPEVSDFAGEADWFRPKLRNAASFTDGFATNISVVGSRYRAPGPGERALDLADGAGNATFTAIDGGLADALARTLTIQRDNSVLVVNRDTERLKLTLDAASGLFSGKFIHPVSAQKAAFQGVLLQKQNVGTGFFSDDPLGGAVSIQPVP